tara:strand:+ start:98 stop:439 length:342 start_codon:yes stop_codon:yes gene_type:complete
MVMSDDYQYKYNDENEKRIVFTDNLHRHTKLVLKLKYLNITQAKFFRHIITGVLTEDQRIMNYIEEIATRSKERKKKAERLEAKGKQDYNDLGFSDDEVEDLFDVIEAEFPEL